MPLLCGRSSVLCLRHDSGHGCRLLPEPNAFSRSNLESLQVLARQVVTRLELYATGHVQENVVRSRQRSEQALTVERNFVAAVLNTISALVLVFDTAGRIVRFNRACETISGYTFADLAGRAFPEELFPPGERETAIRIFEQVRTGNATESYEINWRTKSGGMRRIAWTATSLANAQDEVGFVIMTGADVTEQREAETALRTSEERYRQLVESSLGFICTHDLNGVLLSINSHAAATLGYEPEELIGTPLRNYIDTDHLADYDAYFEALKQDPDQDHQGRFYLRGKDGPVVHRRLSQQAVAGPGRGSLCAQPRYRYHRADAGGRGAQCAHAPASIDSGFRR